jgi:High potential iron-sulfur protein
MNRRRTFFITSFACSTGLAAGFLHAQAKLDDKDPQALALGYVSDSAKADKSKYLNHDAEQRCRTCQLYSGKPTDSSASCPVFSGKHVAAIGWCSAHAKKVS